MWGLAFQLIRNCSDSTRNKGSKVKEGKFRLEIQKKKNPIEIEEAPALQCK